MEIEILEVAGIIPAMQALRLPFSKEPRSKKRVVIDTTYDYNDKYVSDIQKYEYLSKEDVALTQKLIKAGDEHAKVLRGVIAYMKIAAPRYWWHEMATYKVGCECLSSTSTMHTITKGVTPEMFACDKEEAEEYLRTLQPLIETYNLTKTTQPKDCVEDQFLNIKRHIPECLIQTRILAISYQTLRRIYHQRHNHRLPEWFLMTDSIKQLPLADKLIIVE